MTKLSDPLGQAFIEFFEAQGIKFVDARTGEQIRSKKKIKEEKNGCKSKSNKKCNSQ